MDTQPIDPNAAPAPVAAETVQALSGFADGTVIADGTTVKGDYDENGNLIGWHKEGPATPVEVTQ